VQGFLSPNFYSLTNKNKQMIKISQKELLEITDQLKSFDSKFSDT
jgi:hypothetical protein